MAAKSDTAVDWVDLRRRIKEFADQRNRPPTGTELRRFLAECGIAPEMLATYLATMTEEPLRSKGLHSRTPSDRRDEAPTSLVELVVPAEVGTVAAISARPPVDDTVVATGGREGETPGPWLAGRLGDLVEDLVDDWHRQGGVLRRDQVLSLAAKRKLTGPDLGAVDQELSRLGVDTLAPSETPGAPHHPQGAPVRGRTDLVGAYLAEIARYRLIDAEEEVRLGRAIHAGQRALEALADPTRTSGPMDVRLRAAAAEGRSAHTRLVEANLRLVVSVARQPRYVASTTEFIDRIQDGNRGLMHAADKFDPELGFKFSTYATWWIKQAIERAIADTGRIIRLPVHVHEKLNKLRRIRRQLAARLDRDPTLVELAEATSYSPGEVQAMTDYLAPIRSLQESVGEDTILLDLLADQVDDVDGRGDPQDHYLTFDQRQELDGVLDLLPARQREILVRRYDLHGAGIETLDAIGIDLGITRERVRQLEKKTLDLLQSSSQVGPLYDYLLTDSRLDLPLPPTGWPKPPALKITKPRAADTTSVVPERHP